MEAEKVPSLGTQVRAWRKKTGMTQAQLARTVGVGVRFLRELEADKPSLQMDKVNQVLWIFGRQLGAITLQEEEPETYA